MAQLEKKLLWHPRCDNKFVVGGNSQIALYELASEYPEIRHVTSQHDLHSMKCFSWSPDPAFDDLIAVGLSTGRVDLLRIEAGKHARRNNVLSSGPVVSLPVRSPRSCNSLAFSNVDPNYLAVGLDKVRGEPSLIIWDIISSSAVLNISPTSPSEKSPSATSFPLLHRPQPQIPRVDPYPRSDSRILQQHAPTETVSSLAFVPKSPHVILAGISNRWLRLFDLRTPTANTVNVAAKVQGIAPDPCDSRRFACFGDGVVTVWDHRKLVQPILMFTERDAGADGAWLRPGSVYANIEFSSTRRGCLATLEKDSGYVRFWDISQSKGFAEGGGSVLSALSDFDNKSGKEGSRASRRSWAPNLPWPTGNQPTPHSPKERDSSIDGVDSFVLSDTRRTRSFPKPLVSFSLVPRRDISHPLTSNVMVVNKEGDLQLYAIHDTPKQNIWNARGDLTIGAGTGLRVLQGFHDDSPQEMASSSLTRRNTKTRDSDSTDHFMSSSTRPESVARGRSEKPINSQIAAPTASPAPAWFGRGTDDGFPALGYQGSIQPTGLSVTRPGKSRTYSPASLRKYKDPHEHTDRRRDRSQSRTDTLPAVEHNHSEGASSQPSASLSPARRRKKEKERDVKGISHIVEDDISMVMRKRALAGYSLSQPQQNIMITQDDEDFADGLPQPLSELWAWLFHSHELLSVPTPLLHGYDFSYQGLSGIWEGITPVKEQSQRQDTDETPVVAHRSLLLDLPSPAPMYHSLSGSSAGGRISQRSHSPADDLHGNWHAALTSLASRKGADKSSWKPTMVTSKLLQRQIALQLCGWNLKEEELLIAIKRWEREGKISRAACWLVFIRQYSKAVDLLMRSDDEAHRMMSGTVAALIPHNSGGAQSQKGFELREHCERLIVRLQDPYFRAMLTHLVLGDWSEVLEEEVLPFRERLAIAFQFLDDKSVSSYLRRSTERASIRGDIEAILISGLTKSSMGILQSYLDCTGDVQTVALLSSYVCPHVIQDSRAERWVETYRDLLDGFKLYHHRVGFDIERGQILGEAIQNGDIPPIEWVPRQITIRCYYCNKPAAVPEELMGSQNQKGRSTRCSNCNRALPRCSVCLMTLSIMSDSARDVDVGYSQFKDTIDEAIVICQTCRHGGHASHILEWFFGDSGTGGHGVCPVSNCQCRCADEF